MCNLKKKLISLREFLETFSIIIQQEKCEMFLKHPHFLDNYTYLHSCFNNLFVKEYLKGKLKHTPTLIFIYHKYLYISIPIPIYNVKAKLFVQMLL